MSFPIAGVLAAAFAAAPPPSSPPTPAPIPLPMGMGVEFNPNKPNAPVAAPVSQANASTKIAVLELNGADAQSAALARSATLLLPAEVRASSSGAQVISLNEIQAMLGLERQKQLLGCGAGTECITEIAGALGVNEMVNGSLGKLGSTFVLELRRIDVKKSRTIATATRTVKGEPDELVGAVRSAVREVFGVAEPAQAAQPARPSQAVAVGTIAGGTAITIGAAVALFLSPDMAPENRRVLVPVAIGVGVAGVGAIAYGIFRFARPAGIAMVPMVNGLALNAAF